jgi:hypothetical protein
LAHSENSASISGAAVMDLERLNGLSILYVRRDVCRGMGEMETTPFRSQFG